MVKVIKLKDALLLKEIEESLYRNLGSNPKRFNYSLEKYKCVLREISIVQDCNYSYELKYTSIVQEADL